MLLVVSTDLSRQLYQQIIPIVYLGSYYFCRFKCKLCVWNTPTALFKLYVP